MCPTSNDLLEYTQKGIKNLNWSVKEWNGLIEAGAIYPILNAFTIYFRISRAIDRLSLDNDTQRFVFDCKNAQNRFVNACNLENVKKIILKLDDAFFAYLNEKMYDVINSSKDSILFKDDDSYPGGFSYDSANDFIELFTGLFHLIKFIDGNYPDLQFSYLKEKFSRLEDRFKKEFYHFTPLEEQLSHQSQRLLPYEEEWWYKEKPSEFKNYMEVYFVPINVSKRIGECPPYEELAGFAFDEISEEVSQKVEEHIYKCDYCFDEVFQLRNASQEIIPQVGHLTTDIFRKIIISYILRRIESKLKEIRYQLRWRLPRTAGSEEVSEDKPIDGLYKVSLKPEDVRELALKTADEEVDILAPLVARIEHRTFYYKVYGVYIYNKCDIKEFSSGEAVALPSTIQLPNDTNLSIVLIGIDNDELNENSEKLMKYLINKEEQTISDIACIWVEVKSE